MHGVKTSFKTFTLLTSKPQPKFNQPIRTRRNWIIRGNKHKCVSCKGITRIILGVGNGKNAGFYPVNIPYPHKPDCSNK